MLQYTQELASKDMPQKSGRYNKIWNYFPNCFISAYINMKQNSSIITEHPRPSFWNAYPTEDIAMI